MSIDELKSFSEYLEDLGLNDQQPISDLIGVVFEEDSTWFSLRLGELKAMLALATGNLAKAAQWSRWLQHAGFLPAPRQLLYRAIIDLIHFEMTDENPADYLSALKHFFGDSLVARAQQIISGELTFSGLKFAGSWEEISPAHNKLLRIYKKLRPLKTTVNP